MLGHIVNALLVYSDHCVIVVLTHSCKEFVSGDTRIVYKSVNAAEISLYLLYHICTLVKLGNICRIALCLNAESAAFLCNCECLFLVAVARIVVDDHIKAVLCKALCDAGTDPL